MTPALSLPARDTLKLLLQYLPETGQILWRERPIERFTQSGYGAFWNRKYAGTEAFTTRTNRGYKCGKLENRIYAAHRIAWKMSTGDEPQQIDHLNGDVGDNRLENLRPADFVINGSNRGLNANNKSGVCGVHYHSGHQRWRATIKVQGRIKYLGLFSELSDAIHARRVAEKLHGFHENHGRRPSISSTIKEQIRA